MKTIWYSLGFWIFEWNTFGKKRVCRVIQNRPWWRPKELMWTK